jgi:hypothetical protein
MLHDSLEVDLGDMLDLDLEAPVLRVGSGAFGSGTLDDVVLCDSGGEGADFAYVVSRLTETGVIGGRRRKEKTDHGGLGTSPE